MAIFSDDPPCLLLRGLSPGGSAVHAGSASSMYSETMTPADFLDFRDYPFRRQASNRSSSDLIETRLGLAEGAGVPLDGQAVESRVSCADRHRLAAARRRSTIFALLDT